MIKSLGRRSVVLLAASALLLAGCSGGGNEGGEEGQANGAVTIEWWHIQNTEPMRPVWDALAKEYMAQNPNVKIEIQAIENDAFKPKLTTVTQSGDAPDIFQTWGGGVLAQQAQVGLVKDLTNDVSSWFGNFQEVIAETYKADGKIYAVPYDAGMVGIWYNKKLFKEAGIEEVPETWSEFIDAVKKLKAANITPIALAGKAEWPGHYWWTYLAMRIGGLTEIQQAIETKNWNTPTFIKAGQMLKELVDLEPFQKGFLGAAFDTPDGEAAQMGSGKAAMELQGQWAPSVQKSAAGDLGDDLGFFPFPEVEGGKGSKNEALGGGGGFAVGADAPAEAVDFLKFISTPENHGRGVESGGILPVVKGTEDRVTDQHSKLVVEQLASTTAIQLYLDQALPPAVGQEINSATAALIAGQSTPEQVAQAITETHQAEAE